MKNLKVIAFDADDTLFINETYFAETEQKILWLNGRLFVASKYF
jgi:putative hydrolase of the HAD superfamily